MEADTLEIVKTFTPAFLGVIGVIITVIFSVANKKMSHQKMEKELFTEFNKRYDELNDSLSLLTRSMTIDELKSTKSRIHKKSLFLVLIDYFNLCAEQYYWKEKGRISNNIWGAWHVGMKYYYDNFPVVKELWQQEIKGEGYKSYYLKSNKDFFVNSHDFNR